MSIPGLGPLSRLALVAAVPTREYSMPLVALRPGWAWCHGSTGREARTRLGSITRHGNSYNPAQPGAGREVSDLGDDGQGCRAQSMLPAPALDPGAARKPTHQHTRRCRRKPYRARRLRHHAERPALRPRATASCRHEPLHRDPARREGSKLRLTRENGPPFPRSPPAHRAG